MKSSNRYDVLIVGGGVIGLAVARELRKKGVRRIAVAERGEIGKEASFAAAGMLLPHAETNEADDFYRFCMDSFGLYDEFATELLDETGIDIELDREGTLYLAFDEKSAVEIGHRFAWQSRSGMGVERVSAREIRSMEPLISPNVLEGLFFPNDWQVENRKLLAALLKYAELNGISIIENCEVNELILESGNIRGAEGKGVKLLADNTVLATGAWTSFINIGGEPFPIPVKPMKGQMLCFRAEPGMLRKVVFGPNGYLVPRADGRILAGATVEDAGFDKAVTADGVESLRSAALEAVPATGNLEVIESWAGLRPMAGDGLPVLGDIEGLSGLHIATAHFRNGILLAPLTAKIIAAAVCAEGRSEYIRAFGTRRFTTAAASG
ncbi:MAG: glycine oxidase ThiO [Acidobacteriota bacterium]